jgi:hypothetical protein
MTLKNIFQVYFDLKKDIQNISQIFVFFKVIYTTVELAAILYQLFSRQEDDLQIYHFNNGFLLVLNNNTRNAPYIISICLLLRTGKKKNKLSNTRTFH